MDKNLNKTTSEQEKATIKNFIAEVERRAESNMLKTHKLEGSHYAAMKEVAREMGVNDPPAEHK